MSTENIPNEYQDLLAELESTTKVSPVEKAGLLRLSIRGNVFRKLADN